MVFRLFVSLAATLTMASTLIAGARTEERFSAWQMLIEGNPSIADDASIDWRQRLILHLLTPRQAEEYFAGRATADELILADGRPLAAALEQPTPRSGGVYVPLPVSCRLFAAATDDPGTDGFHAERSFRLGEFDLSAQGGSPSGCPVPPDAMAVVLQIRAHGIGLMQPRIKLWADGMPEPAAAAMERGSELAFEDRTATAIVNLCATPECGPAGLRLKSSHAAAVEADLIGYFRPLSAAEGIAPRPIFPLAFESAGNNFFGTNAGANTTGGFNSFFGGSAGRDNTTGGLNSFFGHSAGRGNTTGNFNSFFGGSAGFSNNGFANSFFGHSAGSSNTTGGFNSFFGNSAGSSNTTGFSNSFFGNSAGSSNTTEHNNSFIGANSNGAAGVTNATALGYRAQVSQSNSLVLGSIAGVNAADASVNVGIGTPAPQRQLHLSGNNAVFRMDRSADTAAFILVRTNASGTPLKTFVVGTNASGANSGEFIINDLGQAVGGAGVRRMTITNAGETHFTGTVRAPAFVQTSSLRYKSEVETVRDAVGLVSRLRGVSFTWKETGKPSLGLIAEEAAEVIPELVEKDAGGVKAEALNYSALVAVLVEAVKDQQQQIVAQQERRRAQQAEIELQQTEIQSLRARLTRLEGMEAEFLQMKSLLNRLSERVGFAPDLVEMASANTGERALEGR